MASNNVLPPLTALSPPPTRPSCVRMTVTNHDASDRQTFVKAESWPRDDRATGRHVRTDNDPKLVIYDGDGTAVFTGTPFDIPVDMQDETDRIRMGRLHAMLFGSQAQRDRIRRPTPKGMAETPVELLGLASGPV
jgi:hypothetical protein